ncbi:MAG TPA: GAF domain-containing protein [Acidimicrobiales bacterium]|nr:GAF domain-containing protein [Acidimicrobiales bacterium]
MNLDALITDLAQLDHSAAMALVEHARADGASVEAVVTTLLAPALAEIGRRWAAAEIGAAEALAAAAIARQALPRSPAPHLSIPTQHGVAVCCPPGEHHEIPAEMVTELLRAEGCPAQHLGAGINPRHLPGYLNRQRPAALIISCTTPCGLPGAARSIEVAHAYGVPVIVGGAAFGRDALLALRLGAAAWAPSARQVPAIVESWLSRPVALPSPRPLTEEYLMFEAGLADIRAGVVQTLRSIDSADGPGTIADTQDRLDLLLRHLGAALLVDDGRLFLDFLSWRSEYYAHRDIGPDRLANTLSAVSTALPAEFGRARRFVDEGRQHVGWLARVGTPGAAGAASAVSAADQAAAAARPSAGTANVRSLSEAAARTTSARPASAAEQRGRVFADLLYVAATTCHAPYALISVSQGENRWSTLGHGVERRDLLSDDRLFSFVGRANDAVEIADLAAHPQLGTGPLARGPLGIRFVYGMPLRTRQSSLLGVLCVLDRRPRELTPRERQALAAVARQVAGQLAMWRRAGAAGPSGVGSAAHPGGGLSGAAGALSALASGGLSGPAGELGGGPSERPAATGERHLLRLERDGSDELLRSHEVAVLFDVTDRTVINWAAAGKLPSIRTAGGHLRFRGEDVLALLAGRPADGRTALA